MPGPYQTETEVLAEAMPREVSALHRAGRVRSGDPDRLVHDTVLRHLIAGCDDAGVELGAVDRRTLEWLVGCGAADRPGDPRADPPGPRRRTRRRRHGRACMTRGGQR